MPYPRVHLRRPIIGLFDWIEKDNKLNNVKATFRPACKRFISLHSTAPVLSGECQASPYPAGVLQDTYVASTDTPLQERLSVCLAKVMTMLLSHVTD